LIGSHLGWGTISVPGDEPGFVVASGELDECGSQLFDGVEGPPSSSVIGLKVQSFSVTIATGRLEIRAQGFQEVASGTERNDRAW
jgi:hypothetical protein